MFNHEKQRLIKSVSSVSGLFLIFMRNISPVRNVMGRLIRKNSVENIAGREQRWEDILTLGYDQDFTNW